MIGNCVPCVRIPIATLAFPTASTASVLNSSLCAACADCQIDYKSLFAKRWFPFCHTVPPAQDAAANGKSQHVIGNCIPRLAITIVMLADCAAMKQYVQAYDRELHPESRNFYRHASNLDQVCKFIIYLLATSRRTPCSMVFRNAPAKRKLVVKSRHNPPKSGRQRPLPVFAK